MTSEEITFDFEDYENWQEYFEQYLEDKNQRYNALSVFLLIKSLIRRKEFEKILYRDRMRKVEEDFIERGFVLRLEEE